MPATGSHSYVESGSKWGKDLKVGDVVGVWWNTDVVVPGSAWNPATLLKIDPYDGTLNRRGHTCRTGTFHASKTHSGALEMVIVPDYPYVTFAASKGKTGKRAGARRP